jgi:hypothetical protein
LSLADIRDKLVKFGAVVKGKTARRELELINKSATSAVVLVGFSDHLPLELDDDPARAATSQSNSLSVSPVGTCIIPPGQRQTYCVVYSPSERRTTEFTDKVCLTITGAGRIQNHVCSTVNVSVVSTSR